MTVILFPGHKRPLEAMNEFELRGAWEYWARKWDSAVGFCTAGDALSEVEKVEAEMDRRGIRL